MDKIGWEMSPTVLGLTFLTISPGVSGIGSTRDLGDDEKARALVETVLIGVTATVVSKSWWPLLVPAAYLIYDYAWSRAQSYEKDAE